MDKRTQGVLLGMVAGDGQLNVRERLKSGKYRYVSAELAIRHSTKQRAYCEHKLNLCRQLLGTKATLRTFKCGPGKKYGGCGFTVSNPYFRMLKGWTYIKGKKTFNSVWLDHMTPEGIAIWYMDDGHARRNYNKDGRVTSVATSIATCCSEQEVDIIIKWFDDVHKIRFKPFREGSGWSIQCNTENSRLFAHLVRPFVVEPMLYKLSHVADLSSHECRAPVGQCVHCSASIYDNRRRGLCDACYSRRYYREVRRHREGREHKGFYKGDDIVRPASKDAEVGDKEPSR